MTYVKGPLVWAKAQNKENKSEDFSLYLYLLCASCIVSFISRCQKKCKPLDDKNHCDKCQKRNSIILLKNKKHCFYFFKIFIYVMFFYGSCFFWICQFGTVRFVHEISLLFFFCTAVQTSPMWVSACWMIPCERGVQFPMMHQSSRMRRIGIMMV